MTDQYVAKAVHDLQEMLATVPQQVNQPKDVQIAEDLIQGVGRIILTSPQSALQDEPERPLQAGFTWGDLSETTRRRYAQIMIYLNQIMQADSPDEDRTINPDYVGVAVPTAEQLEQALTEVRLKLLRLGELMQQPYSGMVQRDS